MLTFDAETGRISACWLVETLRTSSVEFQSAAQPYLATTPAILRWQGIRVHNFMGNDRLARPKAVTPALDGIDLDVHTGEGGLRNTNGVSLYEAAVADNGAESLKVIEIN